jgi:sialic acid synthase SpsE
LFLCTPFGLKSALLLRKINPKMVKIASPELNFTALLEEIAGWGLPILLSSGVSRLSDIEEAVGILGSKDRGVTSTVCLLHCVTAYPAPETDYNLRVLPNLSAIFGLPVGVSDHSADPELVPALAVSMGAAVVEKHFCLSRSDPGLDDPIALPPEGFSLMVKAVRCAAEAGSEETLALFRREHGSLVERILGNGVKELAPSEKANYRFTNRSIHALRDIHQGEVLRRGDYAVLRTEKNLRPGLEPNLEAAIEGRTARNFIPAGEGIRFEDV